MKILLDENVPKKLKIELGVEHEVVRVQDLHWQGKKNGELLGLMTMNGFDMLITLDKTPSAKLTSFSNLTLPFVRFSGETQTCPSPCATNFGVTPHRYSALKHL